MVCSYVVGFDFGFYFWSQVARVQGITYDSIMRRNLFHLIKVVCPTSTDRAFSLVKSSHRRVVRILKTEVKGGFFYCARVGRGFYPKTHDSCYSILVVRRVLHIRDLSDCCFTCAVLWLDTILKHDTHSGASTHYLLFTPNARAWLLLYIVNLDYYRYSTECKVIPRLDYNLQITGSLEQLIV